MDASPELAFEILAVSDDATRPGGARPAPETIERIRQSLVRRGIRCHPTPLGLVCYAPSDVFEKTFSVRLRTGPKAPGQPPFVLDGVPSPPQEIAGLIELVTIPGAPELF